MQRKIPYMILFSILLLIVSSTTYAANVSIPNTFESGTTAMASEVNGNFSAVKSAVDDNDGRIADLESTVETLLATIAALQDRIADMEESDVMALEDYVSVDDDSRGPLVQFSGVNLQVVNGLGETKTINGLGNLIVGYDETNTTEAYYCCSDGNYDNQADCESADETWGSSFKTGSHYLVLGAQNSYSQYGGLVAGVNNFARGMYGTVTGGLGNDSSAVCSSISGGQNNIASGVGSNISGGSANTASATLSHISGGTGNIAEGDASSICGGGYNRASNSFSSVSGGRSNIASGTYSNVSGGFEDEATSTYDWRAGDLFEDD